MDVCICCYACTHMFQVFHLFHMYVVNVPSGCFKSKSGYCTVQVPSGQQPAQPPVATAGCSRGSTHVGSPCGHGPMTDAGTGAGQDADTGCGRDADVGRGTGSGRGSCVRTRYPVQTSGR